MEINPHGSWKDEDRFSNNPILLMVGSYIVSSLPWTRLHIHNMFPDMFVVCLHSPFLVTNDYYCLYSVHLIIQHRVKINE